MDTMLLAELANRLPHGLRLQKLASSVRDYFKCGAVALLKLEGSALRPVAAEGLAREALGRRFEVAQHPRLAAILASRTPVRFEPGNTLPDPYDGLLENQLGQPLPVHDCMGISLYVEGQLWGALTLDALHDKRLNLTAHVGEFDLSPVCWSRAHGTPPIHEPACRYSIQR